MSAASGIGSWPGEDMRTALRLVRDLLTRDPGDVPYLPELPARGPGADMIGRAAGLLVDLPVDLQPSGWRLVDRPGRDAGRTASMLTRDLDELAETYDGYAGPLKVQVSGPWTLAAELRVARGERVVVDPGACREVAESLAEGIRVHLGAVQRLVPGAELVLQLDEPSVPAVLAGRLPTSSGYGTHRAVDVEVVRRGLTTVLDAAADRATSVVVHCCAPHVPLALFREAGAGAVALDTTLLTAAGWESVAATVESGVRLWAGVDVAPLPPGASITRIVEPLVRRWHEVGLSPALLEDVVLTPPCGLAGLTPADARAAQTLTRDAARALTEIAAD